MTDIVEMLVDAAGGNEAHVCAIAADEIERLRWLLRDLYNNESLNDLSRLRVREALGDE